MISLQGNSLGTSWEHKIAKYSPVSLLGFQELQKMLEEEKKQRKYDELIVMENETLKGLVTAKDSMLTHKSRLIETVKVWARVTVWLSRYEAGWLSDCQGMRQGDCLTVKVMRQGDCLTVKVWGRGDCLTVKVWGRVTVKVLRQGDCLTVKVWTRVTVWLSRYEPGWLSDCQGMRQGDCLTVKVCSRVTVWLSRYEAGWLSDCQGMRQGDCLTRASMCTATKCMLTNAAYRSSFKTPTAVYVLGSCSLYSVYLVPAKVWCCLW